MSRIMLEPLVFNSLHSGLSNDSASYIPGPLPRSILKEWFPESERELMRQAVLSGSLEKVQAVFESIWLS